MLKASSFTSNRLQYSLKVPAKCDGGSRKTRMEGRHSRYSKLRGNGRSSSSSSARENEVREHIPCPMIVFFNLFSALRHAVKVIFSLGPMIAQAMTNGDQVVSSK